MTDLPHVIAGQTRVSEEHIRVLEAWWHEHNNGPLPAGMRLSAANYNAAVDWWNGLQAYQPPGCTALMPNATAGKAAAMTEPAASLAVERARAEMIVALVAAGEQVIGLLNSATAEGKAEADRLLDEARFRGIVLNELLAEEQPHG